MTMLVDSGYLCLASSMILSERPMPIRFFYRDQPEHQNDTGFRFYSGFETDEFLEQEHAACVAPLASLARIEPSIAELLERSEVGTVWERSGDSWVEVKDYQIPE